eukprot:PLAT204.1.p1 GENE.PLAT204.1~~PLAT204.1.p1  ORF type:complete len:883 (-),score=221.99 PLAT204.1:572-2944(-)
MVRDLGFLASSFAILGASSSDVSEMAQTISFALPRPLAQLSPASTASELANTDRYPLFSRMCPSDDNQARVLHSIIRAAGWESVLLIHSNDLYGRGLVIPLASMLRVSNIVDSVVSLQPTDDFSTVRDELRLQGGRRARAVVLLMRARLAAIVLDAAVELKMFSTDWNWLLSDALAQETLLSKPELKRVVDGSVGVVPRLLTSGRLEAFNSHWQAGGAATRPAALGSDVTVDYGRPLTDPYAIMSYDAVWVLSLAAAQLQRRGIPLNNTNAVLEAMRNVSFDGVSGPVRFSPNGDPMQTTYSVVNWKDGRLAFAYNVRTQGETVQQTSTGDLWWGAGGKAVPSPLALPLFEPGPITRAFLMSMTAILVLSALLIMRCVHVHRSGAVIRLASPLFMQLVSAGCLCGYLAALMLTVEVSQASCIAVNVIVIVGFSFVWGCLVAKTYRIHRLFNNKTLQRIILPDKEVLKMVMLLLLPSATVMLAWVVIATPSVNERESLEAGVRAKSCTTGRLGMLFPGILLCYNATLIIIGLYFTWQVRQVSSRYQEGRSIASATYNVLLLCAIVLPISVGRLIIDPLITYVTPILAVLGGSTTILYFTVVPKLSEIFTYGTDGRKPEKRRSRGKSLTPSKPPASADSGRKESPRGRGRGHGLKRALGASSRMLLSSHMEGTPAASGKMDDDIRSAVSRVQSLRDLLSSLADKQARAQQELLVAIEEAGRWDSRAVMNPLASRDVELGSMPIDRKSKAMSLDMRPKREAEGGEDKRERPSSRSLPDLTEVPICEEDEEEDS